MRIGGISGSLRRGSYNTALLRHAAEVCPKSMTIDILSISDLPLFNADLRIDGEFPHEVTAARATIGQMDGLLIACPEYNNSFTGVLKNWFDWMSPGEDSPVNRIPVALMGGGGRLGTARAQRDMRGVLHHNDVQVVTKPEVIVTDVWSKFSEDMRLTDNRASDQVRRLTHALAGLVRIHRLRPTALIVSADRHNSAAAARLLAEAGFEPVAISDSQQATEALEGGTIELLAIDDGVELGESVSQADHVVRLTGGNLDLTTLL